MDHARTFFLSMDGVTYAYPSGYRYEIACREVPADAHRPAGLKYSLCLFDREGRCRVRYDNAHVVDLHGRPNPVAFDHWHRFSDGGVVPYEFRDAETLLADFFADVEAVLPPGDV